MADKIAVIGAGLIGRAWSISFARAGFDVNMTDKFPAALKKSLVTLKSGIEDLAANDLLHGQSVNEVFERITPQEDVAAAHHVVNAGLRCVGKFGHVEFYS